MAPSSPAAERLPLFVYGTLRPGQPNWTRHLAGRADPDSPAAQPAVLLGAVLHAGPGFPYCSDSPTGTVRGDLVHVRADLWDDTLARLDALEGHDPARVARSHYLRVRRPVALAGGAVVTAWTYLTPSPLGPGCGLPLVPGGDWLAYRPPGGVH